MRQSAQNALDGSSKRIPTPLESLSRIQKTVPQRIQDNKVSSKDFRELADAYGRYITQGMKSQK